MAVEKMKRYNLNVNGVDHTIRLNDEDAEAYKEAFGDKMTELPAKKKAPANKAAAEPANK